MKKLLFIIYFLIAALFLTSCGGHFFNPRYYYNNSSSSLSSKDDGINIPEVEAPEEIHADEDPFKVNSDYNNPNYGGYNASQFDSWLFKASFNSQKLPIYTFFTDSRYWIAGGKDWNDIAANYYQGIDGENTAQGYDIKNLTVYKYDKDNPLYDDNGYLPGRMDRFRFYSINGESGVASINAPLKQYLIAVDTYSKFVYAFGKITKTETFVGQLVPSEFEAVEYHGDLDFYEYDPIGYVDKSGEVIFYQHYKDEFVANPTSYFPKQHGYDNYAEHNQTKPGKSPYVPLNSNTEASAEDKSKFENDIKPYDNKLYQWRDYSGYQKADTGEKDQIDLEAWRKAGYAGRSLILYKYQLSDNGKTLTVEEVDYEKSINANTTKKYKLSMINSAYKATYTSESSSTDSLSVSIVKNDNGENTISVSGKVLDSNFQDYGPIFVDRVRNKAVYFDSGSWAGASDIKYEFNEDGTEFTLTYKYFGNQKYVYRLARFDSAADKQFTAIYEVPAKDSAFRFGRVRLQDYNGKKDNYIDTSTVLFTIGNLGTADSDAGLGYGAYRQTQSQP